MCRHPRNPFRLTAPALAGAFIAWSLSTCAAAALQTRPAATQPAADSSADAPDFDDLWNTPDAPALLTSAAEVRALTPARAATALPVRLRGTITYIGAYPPVLFVQDATGGVCVSGPRDRELRTTLRYGATVQIDGVTARAGDVACVTSPDANPVRIQVIAPGRLPPARAATVAQLATPALHGDLVEVEAVVRAVRAERLGANGPDAVVLTLAQGSARAEAIVIGRASEAVTADQYVGAVVRARGVFNAAAPQRAADAVTSRLLLRSVRDLVIRLATTPAEALPVTAVRTLSDPDADDALPSARVRIQGVVTLVLPGKGMFVQDSTGGVWVDAPADPDKSAVPNDDPPSAGSPPSPPVRVGHRVDVVAFPGRRGASAVLADAAWQITGKAPMPDAPLVSAGQALLPQMDARLLRVDALVLSVSRLSEHTTFVLQSDERVFLARLTDPAAAPPPSVSEGSWVRVSGVCVQTPLEDGWSGNRPGAARATSSPDPTVGPPSFHLLLPSEASVQVISGPGWWTLRRVLIVCGVLAAVALASITWVVALRRRVARQTRLIREHLARRTLYEERVRIARELHDSLEQDLTGITMQLNATEKLLAQPDRARQSLHLAAAMVRRSQVETHRAVWDLREQRPGQAGLVAAVREAVAGLASPRAAGNGNGNGNGSEHPPEAPEAPRVEVRVTGDAYDLPPQVENHLLRVALEAVTNAVKHAGATRIDVEFSFSPDRVELKVSDDGRGFDAERLPPPSSGHFGLFGMRERAEKLGGQLAIRSRPGEGSAIHLVAPTGPAPDALALPSPGGGGSPEAATP